VTSDPQTLDDLLHNAAQAPAFERMSALMGHMTEQQVKLLSLVMPSPPKSESRTAWEAVHPTWAQVLADIVAVADNYLQTGTLPVHPEVRKAGCRR
jgi:hypothetical protein